MAERSEFNSLSIIIPTFNREEVLAKALEAYLAQSSPQLIHELLVVDDGSTDNTEAMVKEFGRRALFPVRYFRQSNQGPATARNLGIREATSNLVLFSDSDIIPERDLVAQHLEWHKKNPQIEAAVLGYVTWAPEIRATPFMRWYGEDGALFRYRSLRGRTGEVGCHFFYTCNLSLTTEFLRTSGQFDEDFKGAGYEDLELGYRLHKSGMKLLYNSAAIGYHYQRFSFEQACRKTRANRSAALLFFRKEAGQQLWLEVQKARSGARYVMLRAVTTAAGAILSPACRLLDSSLPLPSVVYHLFYWYHGTRVLMANVVESRSLVKPLGGNET
jgi:glycosyltransferase involved in cell wall biosynthesis